MVRRPTRNVEPQALRDVLGSGHGEGQARAAGAGPGLVTCSNGVQDHPQGLAQSLQRETVTGDTVRASQ